MGWDLLMGESKKQMSLNVIQSRNTIGEKQELFAGIFYLYSVETDFNEQEWWPLSPIT